MSDPNEQERDTPPDADADDGPDSFIIDILTGNKERVSPKKLLVQKVLRMPFCRPTAISTATWAWTIKIPSSSSPC